jgi:hypothetical protein
MFRKFSQQRRRRLKYSKTSVAISGGDCKFSQKIGAAAWLTRLFVTND